MQSEIKKRIDKAIRETVFPGCSVGVIKGGEVYLEAFGNYTYLKTSKKVTTESIYDVASITKVIPTSSLALYYIDRKLLNLDDRVDRFIPDLKTKYKESILVKHLLTQTLFFKDHHLSAFKEKSPAELIKIIKGFELSELPGTSYQYTNTTSIILGWIIETIGGKALDELADEIFFTPLKMERTGFKPENFELSEIVPTEEDTWRGKLILGEIHDESAWKLSQIKKVGSAGLFTTVPDLIKFCQMLLNKGNFNGKNYFSEEIIKEIYHNQLEGEGVTVGLGWELSPKAFMGSKAKPTTFGKTGFTGCSIICDIPMGIAVVILSNRVHPKRQTDASAITSLRSDITDIVFGSL